MLEELRAFKAVVDQRSLTRAADALALTQSAVSRRIQQLEGMLGATLLDRSTRPPVATAVGRRIYQSATALLKDLDRLLSLPRDDADPGGTFRLGLPQVVADVALFDIALRLKEAFPALDLKCRTQWSAGLLLELAGGEVDAAAVMLPSGSAPPAGAAARLIATQDVHVVQSRRAPIVPRVTKVSELAERQWILNPQGCGYRAALQRAMEGVGKQLRLGVDMHGTETQLRLVAAGLGLGLAPGHLLARSSHRGDLAEVRVAGFSLRLDLWLVHDPAPGNLTRAVDLLREVLKAIFASPARRRGRDVAARSPRKSRRAVAMR